MSEETTTTTGAVPEASTTEALTTGTPTTVVDPKDEQLKQLSEKVSRYEQLVVTPEYQAFLAQRNQQQPTGLKREYSPDEKAAFQEKLNNMSRAEFAAFVRDLTVETVKEQMFIPIQNSLVTDKVRSQINDVSAKFPDFWDYKPEMIAISNSNPTLNAEQVYHLAKAGRASAPAGSGAKPPVRKPGGETPTGPPAP